MQTRRFLIGVLLLAIFLTLGSGFYATAHLASVLAAALGLAFLWAHANVRWLDVRVTRLQREVQVGDEWEESACITNGSKLPVPWVLVEDMGNLPGHRLGRVLGLGAQTHRSWQSVTPCRQRGLFSLGPLQVSSSDPLGIFTARRVLVDAERVLVYPATLPLPGFVLSAAEQVGESLEFRPTVGTTPNVASIRRYETGDSLSRVHWKSSARHGRLMVKEFELERQGEVWVLLDMYQYVQWGLTPENTEEYGVTVAASIASALLAKGKPVGLATSGDEEHILLPNKGPYHRLRLLEVLARVRASGHVPLPRVLARLERQIGPSSSLVIISPSPQDVLAIASYMVGHSISGAAVILDPASFGGEEAGLPLSRTLLTAGLAPYLVRRGDELSQALSIGPRGVRAGMG